MTMWSSMSFSMFFPEDGVEIGLFFVADRKVKGSYPSFPVERIIYCEEYQHDIYADAPEPKESDYYYCGSCHEKHLRECFDDTPVITGTETRRRCEVELAPRLGYKRIPVDNPKQIARDKGAVTFQEVEFTNPSCLVWIADGWFIAYQGHVIGLELFSTGRMKKPKDASLRLTPKVKINYDN